MMAKPLFTKEEISKLKARRKALDTKRKKEDMQWDDYWAQDKAILMAHQLEIVKRVHERATEFLNALIILVGSRGTKYADFGYVFSSSDAADIKEALASCDIPEARRQLYTILRALTEVPKTWARSAFVRFLRGIGKQRGAKYHGAGMFGTDYGWKEKNISAICQVITGNGAYAKVLMSYADVAEEVREVDSDFEFVDYEVEFKGVRVERDVEFLNQLCDMLDERGLADIPKAKEKGPKQPHKPRIFKSGDIIRQRTLRDLPLPAHVRVDIEKHDKKSDQWVAAQLEWVVTHIYVGGFYYYKVGRDPQKAYAARTSYSNRERKDWLDGAIYLGPWQGELVENKELNYKFRFKKVGAKY